MKLLLTVEDSFQLSGRGVVVVPCPSPEEAGVSKHGDVAQVRLARPDATEEDVEATFYLAHYNPIGFRWECVLRRATKDQVPPGTQIWLLNSGAIQSEPG